MRKSTFAVCGGLALSLFLLTGCYNQPETSMKKPGEGPENIHSGPSVGPGTTAGGSTAGPQPTPVAHHGAAAPAHEAEKKH